ncbi:MAG: flagellar basal body P-ring formation protein FlgA [Phycisphaerales bacterium]|nr:flagellar basal body P-ring formation protein FlgA [Phycisphaerales bacterium]
MTHLARILLLVAACLAGAGGVLAQGAAIVLRGAATVPAGTQAVSLGVIADLQGEAAQRLADLVVVPDVKSAARGRAFFEVAPDDVRRALRNAGAPTARLALRGSTVLIRIDQPPAPAAPAAKTSPPRAERRPVPIDRSGPPTVRLRVAEGLARLLKVELDALRVLFDDADGEFLSAPEIGRRVVVEPVTSGSSPRLMLDVRVWTGDRLEAARTVRVDAEVRGRVLVAQREIARKSEVEASAVAVEERWYTPTSGRALESVGDAQGLLARTRIAPGSIVRADHLEAPVVVRRGELVTVRALAGGVEVKASARARQPGARGEVIECVVEGGKKTFLARVEGPGLVVMSLNTAENPGDRR